MKRASFLFFGVLLVGALTAYAQSSGTIEGTITDPSGAVIPNATVTAQNTATNVATTRTTNAAGLFVLVVPQGTYTVQASAAGFQSVVHQNVPVDALAVVPLDLQLKVGAASTNVTVNAGVVGIQTDDAVLGATVQNQVYDALPLTMSEGDPRDPTSFIALAPGVAADVLESAGPSFTSFNGSRQEVNGLYLEGLPVTFSNQQGDTRPLSLAVSVEAVNQFQVEVNGESAQWQGQGFHNYVIKNGTDQFHGTLYEFFRNTDLDTRNYFLQYVPTDHQNEYGGNIGGPIIKGKLFFFGNYDAYDYNTTTQLSELTVPTAAELSGNFSALPTPIYDPTTETCNAAAICTKTQFQYDGVLNVIPPQDLSSISEALTSFGLPAPTSPGYVDNYLKPLPRRIWTKNTTDRVDYDMSAKQRMYGILAIGEWKTDYTGAGGGAALPSPYIAGNIVEELPRMAQIHDSYTISSSLLNTFGIGLARLAIPEFATTESGTYPQKVGLTGLPGNGEAANAFPGINFSGPDAPQSWGGAPANEWENDYVAQDIVEWVHGKHVFAFGGQYSQGQDNHSVGPTDGTSAAFSFSNDSTAGFSPSTGALLTGTTGNAFADYLLGDVDSATITNNSTFADYGPRTSNYSLFAQDDWKVNPKLTLNLGLRWDVYNPVEIEHNYHSYMSTTLANPNAGNIPGALVYGGKLPVGTHYKNFEPRIGFAYGLDQKTVIRGGFLIADTPGALGIGGNGALGPGENGYEPASSIISVVTGKPAFNWNTGVPTPTSPTALLTAGFGAGNSTTNPTGAIAPDLIEPTISGRPPQYINWSLGFQRSIPDSWVFGATYAGSVGHYIVDNDGGALGGPATDSMPLQYLALGSLLSAAATPANVAAAQKIFPNIALPFSNFDGTIATMLEPFPQYSGITCYSCDVGNSAYNSLQVTLTRKLSSGLNLQLAYTLAKEKDDVNDRTGQLGAVAGGPRDPYNAAYDYGYGFVSQRNNLHVMGVYPIPVGKGFIGGRNPILRSVISDWSLSGIYTFESGLPLGVTGNGCDTPGILSTCMVSVNPNFTGNIYNRKIGTGDVLTTDYINKNAFMDPAPYTFGNEIRSAPFGLVAPHDWEFDGTVRRSIPIHETLQFQIAADFFNLFNNVVFSAPATDIDSATFGEVSSTFNQSRHIQFQGRFTF